MTDNSVPLPLETVDATGLIGSELLLAKVGKKVKHGKNGKTYSIIDVVWLADSDDWSFVLCEVLPDEVLHAVEIVRTCKTMYEEVSGSPRFSDVVEDAT